MNTTQTKMIPIEEADADQLRAFAENYLGVTFPGNTKEETMRAKVRSAWAKPEIAVEVAVEGEEEQVAQTGAPPPPASKDQHKPDDKVVVIIQRTEEPGGDEPVFLAVNGRGMLVPRGEEAPIPYPYFEVLKHSVKDIYDPLPEGGISAEPRKVPAYPFQRVA